MSKSRSPVEKEKRKNALKANQKKKYEKLLKEQPNHKDANKWKTNLENL